MIPRLTKLLLLFFALLTLLPVQTVLADTGPKPTMDFAFEQEATGEQLTITSGTLYECEQSDCSDAIPLQEGGPQRFTCEATRCHALAYGFAPHHKISIEFSDGKTRQSNIFQTAGFDSSYTVTIRPDDLLVEAQFSLGFLPPVFLIIIVACLCVLVGMGTLVGLVVFLIRRSNKI
jgi:hypothetical protein